MASTAVVRARGSVPARSRRTTPAKSKPGKSDVDVDAILAEKGLTPRERDDIPTGNMTVFGESFRVLKAVNVLAILMFDDDDERATATAVRQIIDLVHDDDQDRFKAAYAKQPDLSGAALNEIIGAMLRLAASPNPTTSPPASGRTAKRTTSRQLSAAD
jgi:hypothetical protein